MFVLAPYGLVVVVATIMLAFVVVLLYIVAMPYDPPMTKEPALGIRLEADERAALEKAARADKRPLSAMGRKIITEWLTQHGYLKEEAG